MWERDKEKEGQQGTHRREGKETPEERGETMKEEVQRYWCQGGGVKGEVEQDEWEEEGEEVI